MKSVITFSYRKKCKTKIPYMKYYKFQLGRFILPAQHIFYIDLS